MFSNVFYEIAFLLLLSSGIGAIGMLLRQPLIVSFIALGLLVGPAVLGLVTAYDKVDLLAKFGISILLFIVGLKLDIHIIRNTGKVALATGIGQVIFTSVIGFLLCMVLGLSLISALYVAIALTFSSTIIIIKLLSDKKETETEHGRIAVGFLIVQDLVVILVMILINAIATPAESGNTHSEIGLVLVKGVIFVITLGLLMRHILPILTSFLSKEPELLLLFAIAWAVTLASITHYLGFSKEIGAFLAGVSLASTPCHEKLEKKLTTLRDFLLLFFFIDLGAMLEIKLMGGQIFSALVLSLFVLIGNPLIVLIIMGYMGYNKRTSLYAGFTVAQISEFSLILVALGVDLGHIDNQILSLVTLVGIVTIFCSTYMILYSDKVYIKLEPVLSGFQGKTDN